MFSQILNVTSRRTRRPWKIPLSMLVTGKRGCFWDGEEGCSRTGNCAPVSPSHVRGRFTLRDCGEETSGPSEQKVLAVPWDASQISVTSLSRDFLQPSSTHATLVAAWTIGKPEHLVLVEMYLRR